MIYFLLAIVVLVALFRIFPSFAPSIRYGIGARAATNLPIEDGGEWRTRTKQTLFGLGCKIVSEQPNKIVGRTGINGRSWGEDISVEWDDHKLIATSHCVFPLQLLDWGKNKSNVKQFVAEWQKHNS